MRRLKIALAVAASLGLVAGGGLAGNHMHVGDTHSMERHHGMGGHDMANMPGLRGLNASSDESAEIAVLFRNFDTLEREVTLLPDGIRTVTRSSDPAVMEALVSHVTGMIDRVARKDDPQILIQSPTLDLFFERGDRMEAEIDITDEGVVLTRTSDDADLVAAMHVHAAEVTAMATRGMAAVHEMMMQQGRGH